MEFRTEYNLTLSISAGRLLVKALVDYMNGVMADGAGPNLPSVFEVPGVLRIDNLVLIETHSYMQVPNPVRTIVPPAYFWQQEQRYPYRHDPRSAALTDEHSLNVKFVVWQRSTESVNT
ncbi:hypothetical protein MPK66_gp164 [Erwinia phage pEa_SNUABM_2]|uniref:Uncharacterized protein n=1 Tax=Erwinia phage pEa_SNUABM_2 TaxID=2869547 RepID=A0AAE7XSW4_9CAUD|nr:hypothetical protein MPK66_gp164 [Erwinia phage pEa_SNUABM_2]QZE59408.1 hypothetical protein pEaSNUABM2_00164 [Erwinia phage pEa_SNUABM_2]QZE59744.1 hypothetical protein pEaSNUABM39_00164 [Erwinia phage pEa_SNUABM_39]